MARTKRRRRVTASEVRDIAGRSASGRQWLKLPAGVKTWIPEKPGRYLLDFLPYVVKGKHHPDRVEDGVLYYTRPFNVHHAVGPAEDSVVCPASFGKRCPICEERSKLKAAGKDEAAAALNFQRFCAYNLKHPDDPSAYAVMCLSRGKFQKPLEGELGEESGDEVALFWDVTSKGKSLQVRFSEASFEGRKYLEATRFDFRERDEMDEDEILGHVVSLDEAFDVLPYNELKTLFLQIEDEDEESDEEPEDKDEESDEEPEEEDDEGDEEEDDEDEDDEDEDDEQDDEEGDEPQWDKGVAVKCKVGRKVFHGKITKILNDLAHVKTKAGKVHIVDLDDLEEDDKEVAKEEKPLSKNKCPHDHHFGEDCEKHPKDCESCEIWEECDEANEALALAKKAGKKAGKKTEKKSTGKSA